MEQPDTNALSISSGMRRSTTTTGRTIAVLLKPLIDLHGEPKNWATAAPLYIEALADIPPDLLAIAVKHAIASNPFFPKPADLRLSIVEELAHYRRQKDAEKLEKLPKPVTIPPPTPAEKATVDGLVAKAMRAIAERSDTLMAAPAKRATRAYVPTPEQMARGRRELGLDTIEGSNQSDAAESEGRG